jgi:hypothetical protein
MDESQKAWELADQALQAVKRGEVPKEVADEEFRKLFLALLIFEARFEGELENE